MTIIIEREAILTAVIGNHASSQPIPSSYRSPSPSPLLASSPMISHDTAYSSSLSSQVEMLVPSIANSWYTQLRSSPDDGYCMQDPVDDRIPDLEESDDDCTTISSCSSGVREREGMVEERLSVSFHHSLVTEVRTRERTRKEDIAGLFYSCEETQRFRQEYRHERRGVQDDETSTETVSLYSNQTKPTNHHLDTNTNEDSPAAGHRISRVVVVHEDTHETFIDKDLALIKSSLASANNGDVTTGIDDAFFDNDRFWSGQITWY